MLCPTSSPAASTWAEGRSFVRRQSGAKRSTAFHSPLRSSRASRPTRPRSSSISPTSRFWGRASGWLLQAERQHTTRGSQPLEPVLGPRERLAAASRVLALGLPYAGADFRFDPPALETFPLPSLSVIGTGKRVGKTALAIQLARVCARHIDIVVVAMGRGGPPEPELRETPPSVEELLELARMGRHAASDYLEDALLGEIASVGARRCGGGLAGAVAYSNVAEAAEMALERRPDLVVFEGSGAALPPIASDRRVLVVSAHQDAELACGYLNAYRILVSDLLVLSFAKRGRRLDQLLCAIAALRPDWPVFATSRRPAPLVPVAGKKVAFFAKTPTAA